MLGPNMVSPVCCHVAVGPETEAHLMQSAEEKKAYGQVDHSRRSRRDASKAGEQWPLDSKGE